MKTVHIGQKVIVSALAGAMMIPGSAASVMAADTAEEPKTPLPVAGIESVLTECYETNVKDNLTLYLVPTETGEYLNRAFSNTSDYTYIRSAPEENSDWVGKLYGDSAVTLLECDGGWAKVQSGNAQGYVPTDTLYTGEEAKAHEPDYRRETAVVEADVLNVRSGQGTDKEILTQVTESQSYEVTGEPVDGWYPVDVWGVDGWVCGEYVTVGTEYSYGETKAEEEQRLAEEAFVSNPQAAQSSAVPSAAGGDAIPYVQETAAVQPGGSTGQAVIDFACQFIGNPYVWGGTSLTNGADCSGFVQSVYANFGISLPRTTWDMENVGYPVSYDQALPGDLVLYDGHVGLYMGDGNIVNAMNEVDGIGICTATYAPIITIRRVL